MLSCISAINVLGIFLKVRKPSTYSVGNFCKYSFRNCFNNFLIHFFTVSYSNDLWGKSVQDSSINLIKGFSQNPSNISSIFFNNSGIFARVATRITPECFEINSSGDCFSNLPKFIIRKSSKHSVDYHQEFIPGIHSCEYLSIVFQLLFHKIFRKFPKDSCRTAFKNSFEYSSKNSCRNYFHGLLGNSHKDSIESSSKVSFKKCSEIYSRISLKIPPKIPPRILLKIHSRVLPMIDCFRNHSKNFFCYRIQLFERLFVFWGTTSLKIF